MSRQLTADNLIWTEEYRDLMPEPSPEDRRSLKQSIIQDGQQEPIVVQEKGIILDGHTRYEICQELDMTPKFVVRKFASKAEERKFVIMTNLARRHLTKFQKIELAWDIYENEKVRARIRYRSQGGAHTKGGHERYGLPKEGTAAEVFARYMDTGHTVIGQVEYLRKNADQETLRKVRAGEISIARAYDLVRGMLLIPRQRRKPVEAPAECPQCHHLVAKKTERRCHVHRWYCCTNCKWGL